MDAQAWPSLVIIPDASKDQFQFRTGASMVSVRGRVQGVGFRYFVHKHARRLGICGWVRNEEDGSVLIAAAGQQDAMDEFVACVSKGPASARVESTQIGPLEIDRLDLPNPFEVKY